MLLYYQDDKKRTSRRTVDNSYRRNISRTITNCLIRMIKLNPFDFNQMMSEIKKEVDDREFQSVPEEVMAEQAVRESLSKVSPEVREKIRDGKPF